MNQSHKEKKYLEKIMATVVAKVVLCFMGFAVLSIFNINNSFALDNLTNLITQSSSCMNTKLMASKLLNR